MKYFTFILFISIYFVISREIFSWAHGLFARVPLHLQAFGHFPVTFLLLVSGWIPCMASILSALWKPVPRPRMWSIQVPWSWGHGQSASFLHGSAFWHLFDIPPGVWLDFSGGGGTGKARSTPCEEANATLLTGIQRKYSHVYTRWHLALNDTEPGTKLDA